MLIEWNRRRPATPARAARPLPPYLVAALLGLGFATVAVCALLALTLAWEHLGWAQWRLAIETIACAFTGGLTLYRLAEGRSRL